MKATKTSCLSPACLLALALAIVSLGVTSASAAVAAAPQPIIDARPVTPQELKDYTLTGLQGASGLSTIGIGQPAYLEVLFDIAVTDITSVTWALKNQPIGSTAVLEESPLGTNVPAYKPADQLVYQVASRKLLRPDLTGQYIIEATVATAGHGTTNLTKTIVAGTYLGANTCAMCHSGSVMTTNTVARWAETRHATMFKRSIDGGSGSFYSKNCISCHTVGYDADTNAANGGFDDLALQHGWTFPTTVTNGNWDAVPAELKNVANIQCENCHGPGSEHAFSLGKSNLISVTQNSGNCAQCHDALSHHFKSAEWNNSRHAIATRAPTGPGREGCVGCHSAIGFADRMSGKPTTNPAYEPIGCAACHASHDADNPHQLRTIADVTLEDKVTTITNAGMGALCMTCHKTRRDAKVYAENQAGGSTFGPHEASQADMLMGDNGYTYGKFIPSSAHKNVVRDTCVHCHMQEAEGSPGFTKVGGHTFNMKTEIDGKSVEMTEACTECHGEIEDFNLVREDYDGNGVLQGVQNEVKGLMNKLALLLPPIGQPKESLNVTTNWTRQQLKAAYNYKFVQMDRSYGIHNVSYAVGLLKASIADMTGDANNDSLPDSWQQQYFGSIDNAAAAPNATPAGDGIPNWLKYSLGLDPTIPGATVPDGVVWTGGSTGGTINPGDINTIAIFTAAEVVFATEVGKNYQIQAVSTLSGGWQNIGQPIAGTGAPVSYVTPTRKDAQQFYRVLAQ